LELYRALERWERPHESRVIAGVCAAIAERTRIHPLLVRLVFVVLALAKGIGVLLYVVLWALLPNDGERLKRNSLRGAVQGRLRNMVEEARTGGRSISRALNAGRGESSWPRPLDRWWLGAAVALLGAVVLIGSFGLFAWITAARALGLVAVAAGLGLLLSAGQREST
jgi:phage shock protein PspC (stress-responsive transcriptional regulator)